MNQLSQHDKAVLNSIFNPLLPLGEAPYVEDTDDVGANANEEVLEPEVAELQKHAIYETERKNYPDALRLFDEAARKQPNSPKILNDRAQLLRLLGRNDEAMKDLNLAIELSNGQGRAGIRALCQRGMLRKFNGQISAARDDFEKAAKSGSQFARSQLVEMNPYAAMCNQMLREITVKLSNPEP